jgi:hypothetical protein
MKETVFESGSKRKRAESSVSKIVEGDKDTEKSILKEESVTMSSLSENDSLRLPIVEIK